MAPTLERSQTLEKMSSKPFLLPAERHMQRAMSAVRDAHCEGPVQAGGKGGAAETGRV